MGYQREGNQTAYYREYYNSKDGIVRNAFLHQGNTGDAKEGELKSYMTYHQWVDKQYDDGC
jgi:hypothetical protein